MGLHKKKALPASPSLQGKGQRVKLRSCSLSIHWFLRSPLTVSDIYGLHPIPLVNSENNKGYDLCYRNR